MANSTSVKRSGWAMPWTRRETDAIETAAVDAGHQPSLASVEYDLIQLRAMLAGVVDFGDAPPVKSSLATLPAPTPGGLKRTTLPDMKSSADDRVVSLFTKRN